MSKLFLIDLKWENGVCMLAHSFLIKSSSKLLVTRTGIKARMSSISVLWFPWPIYMFFEMRFDLGTLDSGERSLPFGLHGSTIMEGTKGLLYILLEYVPVLEYHANRVIY